MSAPAVGQGKKLVVVGDSGVGKTCIIGRFLKGTFDADSPSGGMGYASKTIEIPEMGESLALDIWDTVGQERYRSLTKFFFQGSKMVILVYDITIKESFDSLKNDWYKLVKEYSDPNVLIGIAGNKSDLYDDEAISEQEAREFAKSIGAVFRLTSAQNNSGIYELFRDMAIKFLDPNSGIISSNDTKSENKKEKDELKQNIKIDRNDVAKKNEEQKKKKKKNPC